MNRPRHLPPSPRQHFSASTPAIRSRYLASVDLQRGGRLDEAEVGYRWVLARVPAHFDAMHLLGVVRAQREDYEEALQWLVSAVRIHDQSAAAFHNLANAQHALKRFDDALASADRALELNPEHVRAWRSRGHVLRDMRRTEEALASYDRALAIEPGYVDALVDRADQLRQMKRDDEAVTAYRQARDAGADPQAMAYALASLGAEAPPPAAPSAYVAGLFDQYARSFDTHLVDTLKYQTPALLMALVAPLLPSRPLDVLDMGCGTGLCGPLLKPHAHTLTGIDLSPKMLDQARQRDLYDALVCDELVHWLDTQPARFDLAVAADVFVYIGDLDAVFRAVRAALLPGGLFAFSCEASDEDDVLLRATLRYAHSASYLRRLAGAHGFEVEAMQQGVIRQDAGSDIAGHLVVLRITPHQPPRSP